MAIQWKLEIFKPVDDINMRIGLSRFVDDVFDFSVIDVIPKTTTAVDVIDHFVTLAKQKLDEREAARLPFDAKDIEIKLGNFEQKVQNA